MANGTDIAERSSIPRRLVSGETMAVGLIAAVVLAAVFGPDAILLLCLGACLVFAPVPITSWLFIAYVTAIWGLGYFIDNRPIHAGPVSLYATDAVALFLLWGILTQIGVLHVTGRIRVVSSNREKSILAILAVYVAYGGLSLAYGLLIRGYAYDQVFGDYRRLFFYSLGLAIPLMLIVRERHLAKLKFALVVGGGIVLLLGLYRILSGTSARLDYDSATGYTGRRLLLPSEISTLSLYVAYMALVFLAADKRSKRLAALVLALPAIPLLMMSGFRISMAMAFVVPVMALGLFLWAQRRTLRVRWILLTLAIMFVAAALTPVLFPEQFNRTQLDLMVRLQSHAAQGGWRQWTWGKALELAKEHPLVGVGIGHQLVFPFRSSEGVFIHVKSGVHNLGLEILYQTGIIGLGLFLALHGRFIAAVLHGLRGIPSKYLPVVIALFVGYLSDLGAAMLQSPGVSRYVYPYLLMGLILAFLRLFPGATEADAPPPVEGGAIVEQA